MEKQIFGKRFHEEGVFRTGTGDDEAATILEIVMLQVKTSEPFDFGAI